MKRLAMLIGNTNGLPGIQKDLENFGLFLESDIGGAWNSNLEICKAYNVSYKELKESLESIKVAKIDYFIFYYSGHGGLDRSSGDTILELNKAGEVIDEIELQNITTRQLNIYDCCRVIPENTQKSLITDSVNFSAESWNKIIREMYDARIMASDAQQISLYACKKGECANATGKGSIYTQNLLKEARKNSTSDILVLDAHNGAITPTTDEASRLGENQHPDYEANSFIPRDRQLILALKSSYFFG